MVRAYALQEKCLQNIADKRRVQYMVDREVFNNSETQEYV